MSRNIPVRPCSGQLIVQRQYCTHVLTWAPSSRTESAGCRHNRTVATQSMSFHGVLAEWIQGEGKGSLQNKKHQQLKQHTAEKIVQTEMQKFEWKLEDRQSIPGYIKFWKCSRERLQSEPCKHGSVQHMKGHWVTNGSSTRTYHSVSVLAQSLHLPDSVELSLSLLPERQAWGVHWNTGTKPTPTHTEKVHTQKLLPVVKLTRIWHEGYWGERQHRWTWEEKKDAPQLSDGNSSMIW